MRSSFIIPFLAASLAYASPLGKRLIDNTEPYGINPIDFSNVEYLGVQNSINSCAQRDLGFTGKIRDKWYAVYGDTLFCAPNAKATAMTDAAFHGLVRDSVALMTDDPLKIHDLNLNNDMPIAHPNQFVPFNPLWGETNEYGFGGTSLVETDYDAAEGAIFYLINANEDGLKGAGIGRVKVVNDSPVVVERYGDEGYWWDSTNNPRYGDVAAYRDERSDYIYAYGGAPNISTGIEQQYAYLTRVKASDAFDLSKYEYWHGRSQQWSSTPLADFNSETAVMYNVGQGQIVWNAHYNTYIFVFMTPGGSKLGLRTADKPEGPWSEAVFPYEAKMAYGLTYAGVAHPYLDPSGKTLVASYTKNATDIEVIKITFKDFKEADGYIAFQ